MNKQLHFLLLIYLLPLLNSSEITCAQFICRVLPRIMSKMKVCTSTVLSRQTLKTGICTAVIAEAANTIIKKTQESEDQEYQKKVADFKALSTEEKFNELERLLTAKEKQPIICCLCGSGEGDLRPICASLSSHLKALHKKFDIRLELMLTLVYHVDQNGNQFDGLLGEIVKHPTSAEYQRIATASESKEYAFQHSGISSAPPILVTGTRSHELFQTLQARAPQDFAQYCKTAKEQTKG